MRKYLAIFLLFLLIASLATISKGFSRVYASTFPGANGKIVFSATAPDSFEYIYSVNSDGSDLVQLTHRPLDFSDIWDFSPSWSPNGLKIAFARNQDSTKENAEIWTMNANGTNQTNLNIFVGQGGFPTWSPDGSKIAYEVWSQGADTSFIGVANADGSGQRNLTALGGIAVHPSWSPDGSKIVFSQCDVTGDVECSNGSGITVMSPDGSGKTRLTNNQDIHQPDYYPSWSPDGSKIAFSGFDSSGHSSIYSMNADGSNLVQVTKGFKDYSPKWSSDSTKIAFSRVNDSSGTSSTLYTINPDGSGKSKILGPISKSFALLDWGPLPPTFSLLLSNQDNAFIGDGGSINLNEKVTAQAFTGDQSLRNVTFEWTNPVGNVVSSNTFALVSGKAEETFRGDSAGLWSVKADFGNGHVVTRHFNVSLFVLPESPIGSIALSVSALAALAAFVAIGRKSNR